MNAVEPANETVTGLLTVTLTPELNALPAELKASDTKTYEPVGDHRGVPTAEPSLVGQRGRADHRGVIAVVAAEKPELNAGGVRGGSVKGGRSRQRCPARGDEHARRWRTAGPVMRPIELFA